MKRSPDERNTQTYGSLIEIFQQSQMSFSIKRVNVCEHTVKIAPHESFEKCHQKGCEAGRERSRGDGGKTEWKSSEVNTRAMCRGENKLIGKFKMVTCYVINIRGRLWSTSTFQQELKGSW